MNDAQLAELTTWLAEAGIAPVFFDDPIAYDRRPTCWKHSMYYDPRRGHGLPHNPITALVVPRPIGWISTISRAGVVNLAPYSFFNLISGHPPFVMFASKPRKDSQRNAEETGEFVANMATYELRDAVNASSAEFGPAISEPERIGLEMTQCREVKPPRVARSPVALECKYFKTVELVSADGTRNASSVVIGEVVGIHIDDSAIVNGHVDVTRMQSLARLGYMDYCAVNELFSIQRPSVPDPEAAAEDAVAVKA